MVAEDLYFCDAARRCACTGEAEAWEARLLARKSWVSGSSGVSGSHPPWTTRCSCTLPQIWGKLVPTLHNQVLVHASKDLRSVNTPLHVWVIVERSGSQTARLGGVGIVFYSRASPRGFYTTTVWFDEDDTWSNIKFFSNAIEAEQFATLS